MSEIFEIPIFPLNTVLFPGMVLPLHIFEERYKQMVKYCISESRPFGVVLLRAGRAEGFGAQEIHEIGTVAQITQVNRLANDRFQILTLGVQRFRLRSVHSQQSYLTGEVEVFPLLEDNITEKSKPSRLIAIRLKKYLDIIKSVGEIDLDLNEFPTDPVTLAFLTAIILPISNEEKQKLLGADDLRTILTDENVFLRRETMFLEILTQNQPPWDENLTFSPN